MTANAAGRQHDPLYSNEHLRGAVNRRDFMARLEAELVQSRGPGCVPSVMTLDIDCFSRINDTFGYDVGDKALIALHRLVKANLRQDDVLARMEGEKLAILMPETGFDGAFALAERILDAVREITLETTIGPLRFTVSIGISELEADALSCAEALSLAEHALCEAKDRGRDRVVVHGHSEWIPA